MKAITHLVVALAASTQLAAAWPQWLPEKDALVVRQDDSETSAEAEASETGESTTRRQTTTPAPTQSSDEEEETGSRTSGRARQTDLNTGRVPTGSQTATRTTTIDPNAAAGNVVMMTPAVTDPGPRLYKIGNNVTFGWNYTNLLDPPTAVNVLASVSDVSRTWTLTQNMTWETTGAFIWETEEQANDVQSPLLTEEYTLVIYDADTEETDTPSPGKLGTFNTFKFGMYIPQEYVPFDKWVCPTCSAAPPSVDSKALGFALTMSVATVLGVSMLF